MVTADDIDDLVTSFDWIDDRDERSGDEYADALAAVGDEFGRNHPDADGAAPLIGSSSPIRAVAHTPAIERSCGR